MTDDARLLMRREGPVARLTIDRPARLNALDAAGWAELGDRMEALGAEAEVRAIVLAGAGGRAFCAGADISEFSETYATPERAARFGATFTRALSAVMDCPKPVIAEIDGLCVGGGCALILACDLRYASAASRFAVTPTKIGAAYGFGDVNRLVRLVGPGRAKEMLFFAEMIDADEALRAGLVDRVCQAGDLRAMVDERAARLAGFSRNSLAIAKASVNAVVAATGAMPDEIGGMLAEVFASADFREGYGAFLEKRRPRFA